MKPNIQQVLPLDSPRRQDDYITSNHNFAAFNLISNAKNQSNRWFYIYGADGVGKSYLAEYFCKHNNGIMLVNRNDISSEKIFSGLYNSFSVNLDELLPECEERIFHLMNHCKQNNIFFIAYSEAKPISAKTKLADLSSRLIAANFAEINMPDDNFLRILVSKFFSDSKVFVNSKTMNYIISHSNRKLSDLSSLVEQSCNLALSNKSKASIEIIKECLAQKSNNA